MLYAKRFVARGDRKSTAAMKLHARTTSQRGLNTAQGQSGKPGAISRPLGRGRGRRIGGNVARKSISLRTTHALLKLPSQHVYHSPKPFDADQCVHSQRRGTTAGGPHWIRSSLSFFLLHTACTQGTFFSEQAPEHSDAHRRLYARSNPSAPGN